MTSETEAQDQKFKKKSLLDDLSASQIIAGALAAITSMLLASKIGIAGSVIGVGFGSVVSAIASQLYKKFLSASAEKLSELNPIDRASDDYQEVRDKKETAPTAESLRDIPTIVPQTAAPSSVTSRQSSTPRVDDAALQEDATVILAKAMRRNKRRFQLGAVAVALVSALIAVGVFALAVNALTGGQGIGTKPSSLSMMKVQDSQVENESVGGSFVDSSSSNRNSGVKEDGGSSGESSKHDNDASSGEGSSESNDEGKEDTSTSSSDDDEGEGNEPSSGNAGNGSGESSDAGSSGSSSSSGSGSSSGSSFSSDSSSGSSINKPGTDSGQSLKSEASLEFESKITSDVLVS